MEEGIQRVQSRDLAVSKSLVQRASAYVQENINADATQAETKKNRTPETRDYISV